MLFPYVLLIRLKGLITPTQYTLSEQDSALYRWLYRSLIGADYMPYIISSILVYVGAILLNEVVKQGRVTSPFGLFAGVMYVIFMSLHPDMLGFHPIQIANILVLIAIYGVIRSFKQFRAEAASFNAGFFTALAAMIYLPYWTTIVAAFISLGIIRKFSLKERIIFIIGILGAVYFYGFYLYQIGELSSFTSTYFYQNLNLEFDWSILSEMSSLLLAILYVLLVFYATSRYYGLTSKRPQQARKTISIIYCFFASTLATVFFWHQIGVETLAILSIGLGFILGVGLYNMKNKGLAELYHLILLALIIFLHYGEDILGYLS